MDTEAFRATQKVYNKFLMEHPQTKTYSDYGTPAMVHMTDGFGGLPTRNFSSGTFEYADDISGEHLRELILERGGGQSYTCLYARLHYPLLEYFRRRRRQDDCLPN